MMKDTLRACGAVFTLAWRQSRVKTVVAVALMLLQAIALPLAAPALAVLTEAVVAGDTGVAILAGLVAAGLAIASLTCGHFAHIGYFELGEMNILEMDRALMAVSNGSVGLEHHERPEYADRMTVLEQELQRVGWSMEALLSGLGLAVAMTITAIMLSLVNPLLLLLPVAAVPPLLTGRRAGQTLDRARGDAAEATRLARHVFQLATAAGSAKEVKVSGLRSDLRERHRVAWESATRRLWGAELSAVGWRVAGQLVFATGYVAGVIVVVRDAVLGRAGVGDVVVAVTLAAQVNMQVTQAVTLLQELQRLAHALGRFRWLSQFVAARRPPEPDMPAPATLREGIRLRGVGFRYPDADTSVLNDVDLLLPAGATVAVVGENGAGKTSLVKLLCRFYEPNAGRIDVDGVDLARIPADRWRERISVGFQDFCRYEFLAREVVGVGDLPRIDDETVVLAALGRAHAESVNDALSNGLSTQLGKSYADGALLSGGQWQKLALGRAMMRAQPLLLVLDEPTASLDAETEHLLFERYSTNARRLAERAGTVTVLISHRFSTVRSADLIMVLDDGRVREYGSHDQLMASGGLYSRLYSIQAAAYL